MSDNLYSDNLAIISFVSDADIVVKLVVFLLFLASFCSWAIVFDKIIKFVSLHSSAKKFERKFWSGEELLPLYESAKNSKQHPLSQVFVSAINEWQLQPVQSSDIYAKERLKERVYQTMMVTKSRAIDKVQKNLNFLATISSTAPFIGLFGTVWGIMNSFSAIATAQNANLAIVAPGIAEALFATAIGLFAAIPALIFYNIFTNRLSAYNGRIEDFCIEIINLLSRELDKA